MKGEKHKSCPTKSDFGGDFLCRNCILNGLDDSLYNVYSLIPLTKKLQVSLDKKYKIKDAGTKKFIVG